MIPGKRPLSFTLRHDCLVNILRTEITIAAAFNPPTEPPPTGKKYVAIWDTGATNCVISKKIAAELNLQPITLVQVHTAGGFRTCPVYLVSILLPNQVGFPQVRVTEVDSLSDADVLIGMDVINTGDFAVTNHEGKTVFTFRCPSTTCIDFVKNSSIITSAAVGRNSPCPCGSDKKYKRCCGKSA